MTGVYLGEWRHRDDMLRDFEIDEASIDGYEVLLATYDCCGYDGDAFVLLRKDSKLYEVNGSHCSCYGLEGQWDTEPVTEDALARYLSLGSRCGYADALRAVLERLAAE